MATSKWFDQFNECPVDRFVIPYARNLLSCGASSTNLKACVCRLIIADEARVPLWCRVVIPEFTRSCCQGVGEKGQSIVLANGLAKLMQKGSRQIPSVYRIYQGLGYESYHTSENHVVIM